jgi:serine protease Do
MEYFGVRKLTIQKNRDGSPSTPFATLLFAVVVALAVGLLSLVANAKAAPDSFADLAKKLLPSVVNISTTQMVEGRGGVQIPQLPPGSPFEDFFKDFFEKNRPQERERRVTSLGSGFIIRDGNYVVTNNHVIQDADEITVILHDNTRLKAELVGRDQKTDLAVLKVKPKGELKALNFGNSHKARVGDWVVAIGNPFGLGGSVTAGIISARGRNIGNGAAYNDFIQTDASINRGNSGGPLFNLEGQVIGVNTAIYSPTGGSVGIGFSIPSATVKAVVTQLIKHGQVKRGWLGVRIQEVTDEISESLGMKEATGALVADIVAGGPAEKSNLKTGDVILRFDGKEVKTMRHLPRIVAETNIDKPVKVVVWRNKKQVTVDVQVGELDEEKIKQASRPSGSVKNQDNVKVDELGLTLNKVTPDLKKHFKLDRQTKGVLIIKVELGSVAAEKGLRPGDVIVEVTQEEVTEPGQVLKKVKLAVSAGRKSVLLLLEGRGGLRFVVVKLAKEKKSEKKKG